MVAKIKLLKLNYNDNSICLEIVIDNNLENIEICEEIVKLRNNLLDYEIYFVYFEDNEQDIILRITIFTIPYNEEEKKEFRKNIKELISNPTYRFLLSSSNNIFKFLSEIFLKYLNPDQE